MTKYTVKTATPTGKVESEYGAEYLVQFEEDARVVRMSRKQQPQPGQVEDGEIIDNAKYGPYFKKSPMVSSQTTSGKPAKRTYGAIEKDKQDGQRQGMCFNNAANFVNAMLAKEETGITTPEEWAELVFVHARALYNCGDLTADPVTPQETTIEQAPKTVREVFGVSKAVPANG